MLKPLSQYSSVIILVLMGMMMIGFIVDRVNDSHQFAKHTAMPISMSVISDDFDFDDNEDDEFYEKQCIAGGFIVNNWTTANERKQLAESKCSLSLQRGQVRRYSPRSSLADSHNYTFLSTTISGVDLFHAAFF
ncbi:MAG: hypothetical protein K6A67_11120 [Bacteroidales bacterium]|nr:hypothetical protein [Bacteroidales bacterium]